MELYAKTVFDKQSRLLQQESHLLLDILLFHACNAFSRYQGHVTWTDFRFQFSERFPKETPCSISVDRSIAVFATANYAALQSFIGRIGSYQQHAMAYSLFAVLPDVVEFTFQVKFIIRSESVFQDSSTPVGSSGRDLLPDQLLSLIRPLALLRLITLRPPLVAILALKPILRLRFLSEG